MEIIKNLFTKTLMIAGLIIVVSAINTAAATFTVTNTNDSGAGSLRQAIISANSAAGDDSIVFDSSFNTAQTIVLAGTQLVINTSNNEALTITGPGANLLTISGNNASRVFAIADPASISGMTITGGNGVGTFTSGTGGGIYNFATLTLTNVVITGNISSNNTNGNGGGFANSNSGSQVTNIINCTISNNTALDTSINGGGGGISNRSGTLNISGSIISGNMAMTGNNGSGGGINNSSGANLTVTNSLIAGNFATKHGGGIYSAAAGNFSATITGSTISNNTSNSDNANSGSGGGLYLEQSSSTTITASTINGNTATGFDTSNSDTGNAGGIYSRGLLNLTNSTISGNTAGDDQGGILVISDISDPVTNITNSTIVNNTATNAVGGIGRTSEAGGSLNVRNTIIANNTDNGTSPDVGGSTLTSQGYNLIKNITGATIGGDTTGNITGVDPMLGVLNNNGGTTQTHALMNGSPAIDTADPANFPATDQRGQMRPVDGDNSGVAQPDIGSFETLAPSAASVSVNGKVLNGNRGISGAIVHITDQNGNIRTARTNQFGYYRFNDIEVGQTYIFNVFSKQYQFDPRVVTINENISDLNFSPI